MVQWIYWGNTIHINLISHGKSGVYFRIMIMPMAHVQWEKRQMGWVFAAEKGCRLRSNRHFDKSDHRKSTWNIMQIINSDYMSIHCSVHSLLRVFTILLFNLHILISAQLMESRWVFSAQHFGPSLTFAYWIESKHATRKGIHASNSHTSFVSSQTSKTLPFSSDF